MTGQDEKYIPKMIYVFGNLGLLKDRTDALIAEMNLKNTTPTQFILPSMKSRSGQNSSLILPSFKRISLLVQTARKELSVKGFNLNKISKIMISRGSLRNYTQLLPSGKNAHFDLEFCKTFTIASAFIVYTLCDVVEKIDEIKAIELSDQDAWIRKLHQYAGTTDKNLKVLGILGLNLLV